MSVTDTSTLDETIREWIFEAQRVRRPGDDSEVLVLVDGLDRLGSSGVNIELVMRNGIIVGQVRDESFCATCVNGDRIKAVKGALDFYLDLVNDRARERATWLSRRRV